MFIAKIFFVLDNLTISSSEHLQNFYDAADWLIRNQNPDGGWPIPVKRKLGPGFQELQKGWYSAMSQGMRKKTFKMTGFNCNDDFSRFQVTLFHCFQERIS